MHEKAYHCRKKTEIYVNDRICSRSQLSKKKRRSDLNEEISQIEETINILVGKE